MIGRRGYACGTPDISGCYLIDSYPEWLLSLVPHGRRRTLKTSTLHGELNSDLGGFVLLRCRAWSTALPALASGYRFSEFTRNDSRPARRSPAFETSSVLLQLGRQEAKFETFSSDRL